MADEKLLQALRTGLATGLTEQEVKEKLVQEGWNEKDVNGVYGLHILSQKPIGSNLVSAWKRAEQDRKGNVLSQSVRALGLLLIFFVLIVTIDWYGYSVPFLGQYTLRTYIEETVNPAYLPIHSGQKEASTTVPGT